MNKENNKNKLAVNNSNSSLTSLNLINKAEREQAMELFTELCKNKGIAINTPAEALTLYMKAKELNIGFANAIDHMHVINGKTGIDIHILKAVLLRAGGFIRWTKTLDYAPLYKYKDSNDGTTWISHLRPKAFMEWLINDDPFYEDAVYGTPNTFKKLKEEGKLIIIPVSNSGKPEPFDYATEYKFEREFEFGKQKKLEIRHEISRFTVSQALRIEKNNKEGSIWQTNPEIMVDHRAFTFGARAIASDLLKGCYETKELYDMCNIDYEIDSDGKIISNHSESSIINSTINTDDILDVNVVPDIEEPIDNVDTDINETID